jgi:hypothetical protein
MVGRVKNVVIDTGSLTVGSSLPTSSITYVSVVSDVTKKWWTEESGLAENSIAMAPASTCCLACSSPTPFSCPSCECESPWSSSSGPGRDAHRRHHAVFGHDAHPHHRVVPGLRVG